MLLPLLTLQQQLPPDQHSCVLWAVAPPGPLGFAPHVARRGPAAPTLSVGLRGAR